MQCVAGAKETDIIAHVNDLFETGEDMVRLEDKHAVQLGVETSGTYIGVPDHSVCTRNILTAPMQMEQFKMC